MSETFGIVVGIDAVNNEKSYRLIVCEYQVVSKKERFKWNFTRKVVTENQLKSLLLAKRVRMENVCLDCNGKIKGTSGDLDRFKYKPLTIISDISVDDRGVIGYTISNYDGVVKTITSKELLGYCERKTASKEIPVHNAMFISETDNKVAYVKCYPDHEFIHELTNTGSNNTNTEKPKVNIKENETKVSSSKLEELFTKQQIEQISLGKKNGVEYRLYANPRMSAEQMAIIRTGLEEKIPMKILASHEFSVPAMKIYKADLKYKYDIRKYLNTKYSAEQVMELSLGYSSGVDISKYANPNNTPEEMNEIRMRLENNFYKEHNVANDASWKLA